MPAVTILYPRDLFDATDKLRFKRSVRRVVATQMDAIDPVTRCKTNYGAQPEKFIDFVMLPYDPEDADVTALCLATIVTYEWPDRMVNLAQRMETITTAARAALPNDCHVPKGMDGISFTFLGKQPGAWCAR